MDYIDQLNDSQREAVLYEGGPQLVIAGAGSGKTRVLTYRIAHLLDRGVRANHILALTFTNKAAREMKDRIAHVVGAERARYLWMGTFHSICTKILRREAALLGFTADFSIYDTTDSKSVVKQVVRDLGLDEKVYKTNAMLSKISAAKNVLCTSEMYAQNSSYAARDRMERHYRMAEVYHNYQLRLRAANAMDFDDLLTNICFLFRDHPDVLANYQEQFTHVLVDEYQDTNYAQFLIVRQLGEPQNNVCVVGDDAQSIYSFRGADIRNILTFRNGYPDARLFKLERNYRSTQTIVEAANSLIHQNKNQIYKHIYSENAVGDRLPLTGYLSDREEAEGVVEDIAARRGVNYDDIAVLYRTNAQSRAFENELRKHGIAYRIYGGTSFYQRKEVKDAVCYFRLAANPQDTEALLRVINTPARGIGETTMRRVAECAAGHGVSLMQVVEQPQECGLQVSAATQKKLMQFGLFMAELRDLSETADAYSFAEQVLNRSGLMTAAALDRTPEGIDRKQNLDELLSGIRDFVRQREEQGISFTPISDFLAEVSLLTDQDERLTDETPRVTLMTIHAAKGLEFPYVYIVGLEENLFPGPFCETAAEIEEERRLLYVAITRAMVRCSLSYARQRFRNGSVQFTSPSRFLRDIDRRYLSMEQAVPVREAPRGWSTGYAGGWSSERQDIRNSRHPELRNSRTPELRPSPPSPASEPLPSEEPTAQDWGLQAGDRITHRVFGNGTVTRLYRSNDNDKVDIRFDEKGDKTLLLTYAKLTKI
ncbi:MAG: UvrD-helicase domain-containing protein [Paludibacteraceae bacterium]|nr:UvrD-helicase domain-containing protein [Paludibacteraceae bacterium]